MARYSNFSAKLIIIFFYNIPQDIEKDAALLTGNASVPHTRPETPRSVTHTHDEDYSDEDSDDQKKAAAAAAAGVGVPKEDEAK